MLYLFSSIKLNTQWAIQSLCEKLFARRSIVRRVIQFLDVQKEKFPNKGLGFWAEQSLEGSHSKFDKEYEGYKRQLDDPTFEDKLMDCGLAHNERAYGDARNK